jgi:methionine synthase II (cobalamin-independent)
MAGLQPRSGRASGIGSWPGTDIVDTMRTVFGELTDPHVPHLPELPGRGPGADMIGRAAGLLVDLPVDLQPSGWRLVDRPGRDLHRANSWLRQDLDVLAEIAEGYTGPLKLQVTGPWTLAAQLWLPRLERAVVDPGACRDLAASLADGVREHVGEVRKLVPGAELVLQLDEPSLTAVLQGSLPTASGFGRLRPVEAPLASEALRTVLDAATAAGAAATLVHCCAETPPVTDLLRSGAGGLSVDLGQLGQRGWEEIAEAVENGLWLWAGRSGTPEAVAEAVWNPWRRLGLDLEKLEQVVITPPCGLAGTSPSSARAAIETARKASTILAVRAQD